MITKEQAIELGEKFQGRMVLHYEGCFIDKGPRGRIALKIEHWRPNGKCKTWKKDPNKFQLPLKHGFGNHCGHYTYLDQDNCKYFHLAEECAVEREYNILMENKRSESNVKQ